MSELTNAAARPTTLVRLGSGRLALSIDARLAIVVAAGFAVRLLLALFGSYKLDADAMRIWAGTLADHPLRTFYSIPNSYDQLPGNLWILWALVHLVRFVSPSNDFQGGGFLYATKMVPALADIGIGIVLYGIANRISGAKIGLIAAAAYLLNPAVIFLTAIWGHWDSAPVFFALIGIYLLISGKVEYSIPVAVIATLSNPALVWLIPIFLLGFWQANFNLALGRTSQNRDTLRAARLVVVQRSALALGSSIVIFLLATLPFDLGFRGFGMQWSFTDHFKNALGGLPFTTIFAFNMWAFRDVPSATSFKLDSLQSSFGLSSHAIGWISFAIFYLAILLITWKFWSTKTVLWGSTATLLTAYMLPTRVHGSDLFPAVAIAAVAFAFSPVTRWLYVALSGAFFLGLYWTYDLYYDLPHIPLAHGSVYVVFLSLVILAGFVATMTVALPLALGKNLREYLSELETWGPIHLAGAFASPALPMPNVLPESATPKRPATATKESAPDEETATLVRANARLVTRVLIPAGLVLAALVLYIVRLDSAHGYSYDEVYHAYTAAQYVKGNADAYVWYTTVPEPKPNPSVAYEWTHPPVGKLLIAAGIWVSGDEPFGWRIACAIFGAAGIGVAYFLGLRLTGKPSVGFLTALFLLVDGLYFVQSRTGMVDIFLAVFMMGALIAFHAYLTAEPDKTRAPLLWTGVLMGLGIATKWNGVYAAGLIGLVAIWQLTRLFVASSGIKPSKAVVRGFRVQLIWMPISLILIPAAIYLASYIPFFLEGHSFSQFKELQHQMYYYHTHLKATHAYSSKWWEWPLDHRPTWYYVSATQNTVSNIYANGNPFLYWAMVPAALIVAWFWRRKATATTTILVIGFFGQWLPWVFSPRLSFVYHFLPAVPFGALAVAIIVDRIWRQGIPALKAGAATYVAVVIGAFIFFYPIYSAMALSRDRFDMRIWFESWR